jgi:hypothetical protein
VRKATKPWGLLAKLAVPVMSARKARWERRAHKGALGMPSLAQLGLLVK